MSTHGRWRLAEEKAQAVEGFVLVLSASPLLLAGKQQVPRLVWERVDPSPGPPDRRGSHRRGL